MQTTCTWRLLWY